MRFRICTAKTKGTALWTEVHQVDIKNGAYSILLGSATPFPETLFANTSPRWLEVKVGTNPPLPREQMTSVPYALNAETLDALDSTEFSRSTHTHSGTDITTGTVIEARIDPLITRDSELTAGLATKANTVHTHDDRYYTKAQVDALETRIANLEAMVTQLQSLLQNVSRNGNDITFSGVNVHIVNGSGTTQSMNSLGNLIVGYNESRGGLDTDDRSGSHTIVVGKSHNFSSYGGLVVGYGNTVTGAYGSVSGGSGNTVGGDYASVSGGFNNQASGGYASVSGGESNTVSGSSASVGGGRSNIASGELASVSGGFNNQALGHWSFVGGGGHRESVYGNKAYANLSAILGGANNVTGINGDATQGELSTVSGGDTNVASGSFSSVSGGKGNTASGWDSSVSGGHAVWATTQESWAGGSYHSP